MNEFQAYRNMNVARVAMAGQLSGTKMVHRMRHRLAPSTTAASSRSLGMDRKNCRIRNVP